MPIKMILGAQDGGVPVKVWTDDIDSGSIDQLRSMAQVPIVYPHIAVMPDVHLGRGATVGSVVPTKNAIIPAAVGVDIGCGMVAVKLTANADQLPDSLQGVFSGIMGLVPVGTGGQHNDDEHLKCLSKHVVDGLGVRLDAVLKKHAGIVDPSHNHWMAQLGTLGSGNHFIEVCLDEADSVWVVLHSGSRGIGNKIGSYFISKAKEYMETTYGKSLGDLSYLEDGTALMKDYWDALLWAQDYAKYNRMLMMALVLDALASCMDVQILEEAVNCHHNYVSLEKHFGEKVYVTRKGAINAEVGVYGIIPGSMGDCTYIVSGKGNVDSFNSCSHGAGRRMSRGQAKKEFTVEDLSRQTAGIVCRKDRGVLDEIPSSYKSIDAVMANQTDLVDVVHTLRQVVNVKG